MTFTVVDWIFGVIILVFALVGLAKGFINNIFGKLSWVLAIFLSCIFYDDAAAMFLQNIQSNTLRMIVGFILVFIVVFLIVKILQMLISKLFELNLLKSLDRTLGFFFGIVEGLVITALIIFLLLVQPFFSIDGLLNGSFFYGLFNSFFSEVKDISINV